MIHTGIPMYITKASNGNYKFRVRIPKLLQPYFHQQELNKSLLTSSQQQAKELSNRYYAILQEIQFKAKHSMATSEQIQTLVDTFISQTLSRDKEARIKKSSINGLNSSELPSRKRVDFIKEELSRYKQDLGRLKLSRVKELTESILLAIDEELEEDNLSHKNLMFELLRAQVTVYSELLNRNKGDYSLSLNKLVDTSLTTLSSKKKTVTIAVEEYLSYYLSTTHGSKDEQTTVSNFFNDIFVPLLNEHTYIEDIDSSELRETLETLIRFPKRNIQKYRTMCVSDILEVVDDIDDNDRISARTYNKQIKWIKAFYKYLENTGIVQVKESELLKGVTTGNDLTDRIHFSSEEVNTLLSNTSQYKQSNILKVLAYTGMRLSEFFKCSIKSEVVTINGDEQAIRYIDLSDESIKLKTKSSHRRIPLHPNLDSISTDELEALQREFTSNSISKWGNKMIDEYIEDNSKKVLYSLRHTFATQLKNAHVDEPIINELMGHSRGNSMSLNRYAGGYKLSVLYQAVDKMQL